MTHIAPKKIKLKLLLFLLGTIIALALSASLFIMSPLFSVEKVQDTITLEAGKRPRFTPSDFLDGADWCVKMSIVDDSAVNHKKVGKYPIYIYHGFEKYTAHVNVVDTTAPSLECSLQNITIKKGDYITVNTIGMKANDNTGIDRLLFQHVSAEKIHVEGETEEDAAYTENLYLKGRDIWTKDYTFEHGGVYTITVCAMDAYNNTTRLSINVTVEEPPVLKVIDKVYLATGQTIDFADYVEVWDFLDAEYSVEDVVIDSSTVDISKAGEYQVSYTATDDYGLSTQASTTVYIHSAADLQELINTHEINKDEHIIIGAYNIYDSGYYKENNPAFIQEAMLPAIVHIENDDNYTFGSGYILKIDEDFITIATNEHVIMGDYTPTITFHDGTICDAMVVAKDAREDIAFLRIPIDESNDETSLSTEYVETLRTVHINEGYWNKLGNNSTIDICYNCIDEEGNIWQGAVGYMIYKEAARTWNEYENINECIISMEPVGGTSGSAIFDGHGRLIAMVRGYTDYGTYIETVAVPLGEILDYYEMIFHEKLQYQ